jgi:cobalt-precorrin 5A hydrolase/precorrin-3B C17-methyltransferase
VKVVTISVSEPGRRVAERLPYEHVHGEPAATLARRWGEAEAFVLVLALGAAVRLIAPLLTDKATDPAVVCVDDSGAHAIAVCGGHGAGANALAIEVASIIGAEPVVTTATDRLGVPALDQLPGLRAEGDIAGVTTAMLAGQTISLDRSLDWPLPATLRSAISDDAAGTPRVVLSDRSIDLRPGLVALRPPSLVVGVGTTSDATAKDTVAAVESALESHGLSALSVDCVATVDRRADHPAVLAVAQRYGATLRAFPSEALATVEVPHPSAVVAEAVGTSSVAEAAALCAAGPGATLRVEKTVAGRVTVAVAGRAHPRGALTIVGLGPGGAGQRTPEATAAVRHAEVVVGLDAYVEQCADLLTPAQDVRALPIGAELERARIALDLAATGRRVALVCSGDAGVYAMASPTLELAGQPEDAARYSGIEISIVAGVTAGLAAAALVGAPLGHDFVTISLSDLLTPWEIIERRVRAAAECDLVVVLYNPRSRTRHWQIDKVRATLLEHRGPRTPVGVVTDAGRPGQRACVTTLGELDTDAVNMTTCVIVGSTTTRVLGGRMVTPRGYR